MNLVSRPGVSAKHVRRTAMLLAQLAVRLVREGRSISCDLGAGDPLPTALAPRTLTSLVLLSPPDAAAKSKPLKQPGLEN